MSRKDKATANDKSLTVSEYSRQFFERTVSHGYAKEPEENQRLAGQNFINLIRKLQEAGSKDDIKVPLRVLRDEIGRIYFGSAKQRNEKVETLFKLYDALEAGAQEDLQSKEPKQASAASQVLDELRQRFSRLVIGDTWEAWPELKLVALRRLHSYASHETRAAKEAAIASPPPTPSSGRLGMRKLSRSFSGVSASGSSGSWQATIDDLAKAPGTRLLPLIKLLLDGASDLSSEAKSDAADNGIDGKVSADLKPQASGFSDAGDTQRKMGELNMDDLLGLTDTIEEEGESPDTAADPFAVAKQHSFEQHRGGFEAPEPPNGAGNMQQSSHVLSNNLLVQPGPASDSLLYTGRAVNGHGYGAHSTFSASPHAYHQQQLRSSLDSPHTGNPPASFASFEQNAFGGQAAHPPLAGAQGGNMQRTSSSGIASGQPGGFNPFGLPSPSFATPVPGYVDNSFADFSPVAAAPPPPIAQPMRAPPQPPLDHYYHQQQQYPQQTSFGQPPASTF